MKKTLQLFVALLTLSIASNKNAFAQGDAAQIIKAGVADGSLLAESYLDPFFKGFGFGMNSGWYNSAKTKNLGRFDLKIQASGAFVPTADQTFDVRALNLNKIELANPSASSISPTLFGEDKDGPQVILKDNNGNPIPNTEFNLPQGTGFNIVPSPQVQLTVGLVFNTDITLRYAPEVGSNDFGKMSTFGIGVKKELTSLIPGSKVIPFDVSVAFGYNELNYKYEIAKEDQINDQGLTEDLNQRLEAKFNGYTFDAIISKKLAFFTPFLSVGYNTAKTKFGLLGKYNVRDGVDANQTTDPNNPVYTYSNFTNPINIDKTSIKGMRANVGFALHIAVLRLYAAYNMGEYNAVTAGIGIGIGK